MRGAWFRVAVIVIVVDPALSESVDGLTDSTTPVETVSSSVTVTAPSPSAPSTSCSP